MENVGSKEKGFFFPPNKKDDFHKLKAEVSLQIFQVILFHNTCFNQHKHYCQLLNVKDFKKTWIILIHDVTICYDTTTNESNNNKKK